MRVLQRMCGRVWLWPSTDSESVVQSDDRRKKEVHSPQRPSLQTCRCTTLSGNVRGIRLKRNDPSIPLQHKRGTLGGRRASQRRAIGRITWFKGWLDGRRSVIESAEKDFFDFYYDSPGTFWQSVALNVACHGTAILEVYILLCFMGARSGLFLALVLEALTKLINTVGTFNPGNVETYEGGNMIIFRLLGISSAAVLTMALCRRARILFWAVIGALCLIVMSRATARRKLASAEATGQINASDLLLSQIPCDSILQ